MLYTPTPIGIIVNVSWRQRLQGIYLGSARWLLILWYYHYHLLKEISLLCMPNMTDQPSLIHWTGSNEEQQVGADWKGSQKINVQCQDGCRDSQCGRNSVQKKSSKLVQRRTSHRRSVVLLRLSLRLRMETQCGRKKSQWFVTTILTVS